MFGTFRKHSTALWVIVIALIIVSFVIFFTPSVGRDSGVEQFSLTLDGKDFNREDVNASHRETQLAALLGMVRRPENSEEANMSALQRLLLRVKVAEYGIQVGDEATAAWIRRNLLGPQSGFAGQTFDQMVEILKLQGFTADDLQRFARNQAGLQILVQTVVTAGQLVTPQEIDQAFRRDSEKLEVEVAFLSHTNFLPSIVLNPVEVVGFYSNRLAAYRSPDRVQAHYVRFATSNFVADAEKVLADRGGIDSLIGAAYTARGTNFFTGMTETEAKAQIRQEMIDEEAFRLVKRKAYDFINGYWDTEPRSATVLAEAAKAAGLEMKTCEPFARDELPEGFGAGQEFVDAAFKLTAEEPYSTAIVGPDGYYALCFDQKVPGTVQPFAEVKDKVEKEFRDNGSRQLAQEAADKLYIAATNTATGQPFATLAEQAGFTYERLPALSQRLPALPSVTIPVDARQIASLAFNQETNTVGRANYTAEGLLIIRTGQRLQPTEEEVAAGLEEYADRIRGARGNEVFNEWMQQQIMLGGLQSYFSNPTQ